MIIDHQRLRGIMARILRAGGANEDEATCTADHMVDANLAGHDSHGVGMLPLYCRSIEAGNLRPGQQPEIVSDSGNITVWDGHGGIGQVIARDAMRWAIPAAREAWGGRARAAQCAPYRARRHLWRDVRGGGAGFGAFRQRHRHRADRRSVQRTRGALHHQPDLHRRSRHREDAAIILDFATSRLAVGKIRVAHNMRKQVPEGVLLTHDGKHTTDPEVIFSEPRGMLMPFGEHKGSGLALVCDLLCGAIMGMGTLRQEAPAIRGGVYNGMLSFVLDPARLSSREFMESEIDALIAWAKSSARLDPEVPVLVAGEPERIARAKRLAEGIPIDENTWAEIREAADKLQVRIDD